MSKTLEPKLSRTEQNVQLSYDIPHRLYTTTAYPLQSSNGSDILIYGHAHGVRIIWRGGRPFKPESSPSKQDQTKSNGTSGDAVMIIDSDDEQPASTGPSFEDHPEFEDEEEEADPRKPYPSILQYLDLNFGVSVLHIAVPPTGVADNPSGLSPAILKDKVVFGAACADHFLRIITLPLTPPSPASKSRDDLRTHITAGNGGNGKWAETIVQLHGHSTIPDGLSLTFAANNPRHDSDGDHDRKVTSKSGSADTRWDIVVASFSSESSGLLLLHRIPVMSTQKDGKSVSTISNASKTPFQRQYLSSPVSTTAFNPSIFSAYSTHLLVTDRSAACRIYDFQTSLPTDIPDESAHVPYATQGGAWLLTLYSGFQSSKSETSEAAAFSLSNYGRKTIVDAKWVLGGKAIIVLMADGEWGLWDVQNAGPGASKGLLGRHSIKGGAKSAFSISGWVDGAPVKSATNRNSGFQVSSKFAPMTPHTRKTAEPALFSGRSGAGTARGQISVARLSNTSTTHAADESIAFWLEDSFAIIPNLLAYWEAQSLKSGGGSSNLFGGSPNSRLVRVGGVNLRGEHCCGIDQCVRLGPATKSGLSTELIIAGEHRFLIVSDGTSGLPRPSRQPMSLIVRNEKQLVPAEDLDIMAIDQVLDQMEDSPVFGKRKTNLFG